MTSQEPRPIVRKTLIAAAWGTVAGALAVAGFVAVAESGSLGTLGGSEQIAGLVALYYLFIAAWVGLGLLRPGFGARYLNVEDADELREQRRMLAYSAASLAATGAALGVLALAGPAGLEAGAALGAALVLLAIAAAFGIAQARIMDELMRSLSVETGNLAFYLVALFGGGWAMLAHVGLAAGPAPLDWLTLLAGLGILAGFVAVGRRGLLKPR